MTMKKRRDEGERCYRSMKQWDGWTMTLKVSVPGEAAISRTTFLKCVGGFGDFDDIFAISNLL